ncbi:MAG: DUF4255 domain-containing protein [Tannerellaceae bacterium]|nr:DUF4255 domain-containing protein [Tannerellaceae bacterium]
MIDRTITTFSSLLSDYLKRTFHLQEDIVVVQPVPTNPSGGDNKVHLTLVNIEREMSAGISFTKRNISASYSQSGSPGWLLNLYVLISAIFSDKQYKEALQLISAVVLYLQAHNTFTLEKTGLSLAIEPVNLSMHELSNLWGMCGNTYYPSLLCKIRVLNIESDAIRDIRPMVREKEVHL